MLSLRDIEASIANTSAFPLHEGNLGPSPYGVLKALFYLQPEARLINCKINSSDEKSLWFSGDCSDLFPWKNVAVKTECFLFDVSNERHSLFRIQIPDGYDAYYYLCRYSYAPDELSAAQFAEFTKLENLLAATDDSTGIAFKQPAMVFSSVDFDSQAAGDEKNRYPKSFQDAIPAEQLKTGINFTADTVFRPALSEYLNTMLGAGNNGSAPAQCLVYPVKSAPVFQVTRSINSQITVGPLALKFNECSIQLPLAAENQDWQHFLLDAEVDIKGKPFSKIRADLNTYNQDLSLSFADFPSLGEILNLLDLAELDAYFPAPLDKLLGVKLSRLEIVVNLGSKSLSEIGFSLTTQDEIHLIENVIALRPTLEMRILAPFEPTFRSIAGSLQGTWQLGSTAFQTNLYYPNYDFYAGMAVGQTLDLAALVKYVLPEVELPQIAITKMGVEGNFSEKYFGATLEVTDDWSFDIAGKKFALQKIDMQMVYSQGKVAACSMTGEMTLVSVPFFVAAAYKADQGWKLTGGTAAGAVIDIGAMINALFSSLSLPESMPKLGLTDVLFTAAPRTSEYSISARTAGDWDLAPKLKLAFEQFYAGKNADASFTGKLKAKVKIGQELEILLQAETSNKVRAGQQKASGWVFTGGLGKPAKLKPIVKDLMELTDADLPAWLPDIDVLRLMVAVDSSSKEYSFDGALEIKSLEYEGLKLPDFKAEVRIEKKQPEPPQPLPVTKGHFQGELEFENGFKFLVSYDFAPNNTKILFKLGELSCSIENKPVDNLPCTIITVELGNLTLGDMLRFVVKLVDPNVDFQLESPWDVLNSISLQGLRLEINTTKGSGSLSYAIEKSFGFINIERIGVAFQKDAQGKSQVNLMFVGQFLFQDVGKNNQPPLQWDVLNEQPPAVPANGNKYFDLQFLGIGQHVSISDLSEIHHVSQAIDVYRAAFAAPAEQKTLPPGGVAKKGELVFNPRSNLLLGAEFTVLDTLRLGFIFNDPDLYGIVIALNGEKARFLAGLEFEILYKKVTDDIGVFITELKLPDYLRRIQLGAVSLTLPVIGVEIYTNGDFKIDLGFPYNNNFSRSFRIEVLPFVGLGGFYFAKLSAGTAKNLPVIDNGVFNPVVEFGIGLQIGVGKSIVMGPLSAEFSITLIGVIEGCFATFHPTDPNLPTADFYRVQGLVALQGKLEGAVDLAIIKIAISVQVYASVRFLVESYQQVLIELEARVSVSASLQILFIDVSFSFRATVQASFKVGHASPTPWHVVAGGQSTGELESSSRRLMRRALGASGPAWKWTALNYWGDHKPSLGLLFTPGITAADPGTGITAQIAAMLFIENSIGAKPGAGQPSHFDALCEGLLAWALNAHFQESLGSDLGGKPVTAHILEMAYNRLAAVITPADFMIPGGINLSAQQAEGLWTKLYDQGWVNDSGEPNPAVRPITHAADLNLDDDFSGSAAAVLDLLKNSSQPFAYSDLTQFFADNFDFSIRPRPEAGTRISASVFPVFPELSLEPPGGLPAITFNDITNGGCTEDYLQSIARYVKLLYGGENEWSAGTANGGTVSMATYIFTDYFHLIMKTALEDAGELLKAYPFPLANGPATLAGISAKFKDATAADMAVANQFKPEVLKTGADLLLENGAQYTLKKGDTLYSIANAYNISVKKLAEAIKDQPILNNAADTAAIWTIPNVTLTVRELLDAVGKSAIYTNIAGMVSRMLLHGLRLPPGSTDFPADQSKWSELKTAGVYQLTGQQFALSAVPEATDKLALSKAAAIKYLAIEGEGDRLDVSFLPTELTYIKDAPDAASGMVLAQPKPLALYNAVAKKFVFQRPIAWQCPDAVPYQDKQGTEPQAGGPFIWPFPPTLAAELQQLKAADSCELELYAGSNATGEDKLFRETPVHYYQWATRLNVSVRQLQSADARTGMLSNIYEIRGTDEDGGRLLMDLVGHQLPNDKLNVYFLYPENPAGTRPNSLKTDATGNDRRTIRLVRTNLTNTQAPPPPDEPVVPDDPNLVFKLERVGFSPLNDNTWEFPDNLDGDVGQHMKFSKKSYQGRSAYVGEFNLKGLRQANTKFLVKWTSGSQLESKDLPGGATRIRLRVNGHIQEDPGAIVIILRYKESQKYKKTYKLDPAKNDTWQEIVLDLAKDFNLGKKTDLDRTYTPAQAAFTIQYLAQSNNGQSVTFAIDADHGIQFLQEPVDQPAFRGLPETPGKTETDQTPVPTAASDLFTATLAEPSDFLNLLWEDSAVDSGGSYLYYHTEAEPAGLPPHVFAAAPEAQLSMLIVSSDETAVRRWHNCLITKGAIDVENSVFYAQAPKLKEESLTIPPGFAGFELQQPIPAAGDDAQTALAQLYQLVGLRVAGTADFDASVEGLPIGPTDPEEGAPSDPGSYYYRRVIPIPLPKGMTAAPGSGRFDPVPPQGRNSYAGVGKTLTLDFGLQDIYGNVLSHPASRKRLEFPVRYYDPLIPLTQWPNVAAVYDVTGGNGGPNLNVYLDFSAGKYLPGSDKPWETCLKGIAGDLNQYAQICYQIGQQDVGFSLKTSLGEIASQPQRPLFAEFAGKIYAYLSTLNYLGQQNALKPRLHPAADGETLDGLAGQFNMEAVRLAEANKTLPGIYPTGTVLEIPAYYAAPYNISLEGLVTYANGLEPAAGATLRSIAETNQNRPGLLRAGTEITLPTSPAQSYTIVPGDTLQSIAQLHPDVSVEAIAGANAKILNLFQPGARLLLFVQQYPAKGESWKDLAAHWPSNPITLAELMTVNNLAKPLRKDVALLIPDALDLAMPPSAPAGLATHEVGARETLEMMAGQNAKAVVELFYANLDLLGRLDKQPTYRVSGTVGINGRTTDVPFSIRPNETLRSLADGVLKALAQAMLETPRADGDSLSLTLSATQPPKNLVYHPQEGETRDTLAAALAKMLDFADMAQLVRDQPIFTAGGKLLLPPFPVTITAPVQAQSFADSPIFPVTATLEHSRQDSLLDDLLKNYDANIRDAVKTATSRLAPNGHASADGKTISLQQFALDFEAAFPSLKVAMGETRQEQGKNIWAVPVQDGSPYRAKIDAAETQPFFFAPAPLSNMLLSRQRMPLQRYRSGVGLQNAPAGNFNAIDLDDWGRRFLEALDNFLEPAWAIPACQVDEASFKTIVEAKRTLAQTIANSVDLVLEYTGDENIADRRQAAGAALYQRLLENLSSAYTIDSIVQYRTSASSPYKAAETAPRLFGKPLEDSYKIAAAPQNTLQDLVGNYYKPAEYANAAIYLPYVADLLKSEPNLLKTGQDLVISGEKYTIQAGDTLADVAGYFTGKLPNYPFPKFAADVAGMGIFAPDQVVTLVRLTYGVKSGDTPGAIKQYFQCPIKAVVAANLQVTGIIKPGIGLSNGKVNYTTTANDTFDTLLKKFDDLAAAYSDDTITDLPPYLVENRDLLQDKVSLSILKLQPGFSWSAAQVSLKNDRSYLNLLFEQPGEEANKAIVDLKYQVNGLEFDIEPLEALPGYERSSWLSFILPLPPTQVGRVDIPVPLRSYPHAPVLVKQFAASDSSLSDADNGPQRLEKAKGWEYNFVYGQEERAQDELEASVSFNAADPLHSSGPATGDQDNLLMDTAPHDLVAALAQFIYAYPQLAGDLDLLSNLKPSDTPATEVQAVVQAFAALTAQIAGAWKDWHEALQQGPAESDTGFRCRIQEFSSGEGNLNILVQALAGNLPGRFRLPVLRIEGCQTIPASPPEGAGEVIYSFTRTDNKKPFTKADAALVTQRTVAFEGLNILNTQNAWGGVALSRNVHLLAGRKTSSSFIYRTPTVRFVNKLTPLLTNDDVIKITEIGSVNTPQSLARHLSNLFKHLLELGLDSDHNRVRTIMLLCRYEYELGTGSPSIITAVPVLLHPKARFHLRDWEIGNAVMSPTFVDRLARTLDEWRHTHGPNTNGGRYTFEITLFTNVDEDEETRKLLNFLVLNNSNNLRLARSRTALPLSFYTDPSYWITGPNRMQDIHTLESLTERLIVEYGSNIYDVSTMQIALSLYPDFYAGMLTARQWTQRLLSSRSGSLDSIRGWSKKRGDGKLPAYVYGPEYYSEQDTDYRSSKGMIPEPKDEPAAPGAFYFRTITDEYLMTDPLTRDDRWPDGYNSGEYFLDFITWTDWKPITGENGWAILIGPLQLAYNDYKGNLPKDADGIRLALNVLEGFEKMADPEGAIYYAPAGTSANVAGKIVDPYSVSNENNFSSYAGLIMLMEILSATGDKAHFDRVQKLARNLKAYFQKRLYDEKEGCLFTGGTYTVLETPQEDNPDFHIQRRGPNFIGGGPDFPFAVDVHTWGCTVLGVGFIDTWFKDKKLKNGDPVTVYGLWQVVKARAGYYQGGDPKTPILGVGYTDVSMLPPDAAGQEHSYIVSAEWTLGAITMCRVIAEQYDDPDLGHYNPQYAASLRQDADSMENGIRYLLLDTSRDDQDINAYYYANRRYNIPFGWYANRIASLCSTAWAVMVANRYNPFALGGAYNKVLPDPDSFAFEKQEAPATAAVSGPWRDFDRAGVPKSQRKLLNFLIVNNTNMLPAETPSTYRTGMPLSYYAPKSYWEDLKKTDAYNKYDSDPNHSVDAVTERVLVQYGLDIYDAATMQIALAIFPRLTAGMVVAKDQTGRLLSGFSLPQQTQAQRDMIRGWTKPADREDQRFYYGANKTAFYPTERGGRGPGAFFFRSIADQYELIDPIGEGDKKYYWPDGKIHNGSDKIVWTDWKPIAGENAWAALIGPLQVAYAEHNGMPPLDSDAVQLALSVLPAFQAMQSESGGLFYAPWNTAGNKGGTIADPLSLSNENNFSSYAGLVMLRDVLQAGNDTVHLPIVVDLIEGLDRYFREYLLDEQNKTFYTGGTYSDMTGPKQFRNTGKLALGGDEYKFAVDVHTWGCTVLGAEKVDAWFADKGITAYSLWQTVKSKAGYFEDNDPSKRIFGVGYTDVGTLPPEAAGREHSYIVSAEWTFGAINMCLVLAEQYSAQGNTDYTASLRKDAESMMRAMREMMLDKESRSDDTEAYFYSNIRYEIPFGWFGNRIDSLCSTAWAIMMENRFNPFVLGGSLDGTAGRSGISPKASQPLLQLKKLRLDLSQIEEPSP